MAEQKVKLTELPAATDTIDTAQLLINQNATDQKLPVTHFLRAKNNLSELANTGQARANLNVLSVDEVNDKLSFFINGGYSFTTGGSIVSRKDFIWDEETLSWYYWSGPLPKDVPPASSPESTGGIGNNKWMRIGDDASLGPWLQVTANVVGTNDYIDFPGVGETITSGQDYLYNDVLYATVGDGGEVVSVSGNVVTTTGGTAYLLDKQWPINDVRAWGVKDGVVADTEFTNAVTFITRNGGGIRTIYVPPIALYLNSVTISDLSSCNIHFDGTFIIGCATTPQQYVIRVFNAHTGAFTGVAFLEQLSNKYTYGLYLTAGLPSLIAPLTGIFHKFKIHDIRISGFPCCLKIGDGSDAQMSEIDIDIQTGKCNCGIEVSGSQAIASINGQILCEPQSGFTYEKACYNVIGGTVYHNGGEVVSTTDVDGSIARITPVASTLYGNPFGSVKITSAHIECAGELMKVQQGSGITGSTDSKYSSVSFSNCQGSMMNGSKELILQAMDDYEGTFSADSTCNFYSSTTRSARLVYSLSPKFNFEVSNRAFR